MEEIELGYHDDEVNDVVKLFKHINRTVSKSTIIVAWSQYSEDNYCAGWMSMKGYNADEIIKIITEYGYLDKVTIDVSNIQERIQNAIQADLRSEICQHCDDLMPYAASPEICQECATTRVIAAIKKAFPEVAEYITN